MATAPFLQKQRLRNIKTKRSVYIHRIYGCCHVFSREIFFATTDYWVRSHCVAPCACAYYTIFGFKKCFVMKFGKLKPSSIPPNMCLWMRLYVFICVYMCSWICGSIFLWVYVCVYRYRSVQISFGIPRNILLIAVQLHVQEKNTSCKHMAKIIPSLQTGCCIPSITDIAKPSSITWGIILYLASSTDSLITRTAAQFYFALSRLSLPPLRYTSSLLPLFIYDDFVSITLLKRTLYISYPVCLYQANLLTILSLHYTKLTTTYTETPNEKPHIASHKQGY